MTQQRVVVPPDDDGLALRFQPAGPADVLDYAFDFTRWVARAPADSVDGAATSFAVPSGAPTLGATRLAANVATVRVGPGAAGSYLLMCAVSTVQGRLNVVSATLEILPPMESPDDDADGSGLAS